VVASQEIVVSDADILWVLGRDFNDPNNRKAPAQRMNGAW
jgi:hypothetical protein